MSYFKSSETVKKNARKWASNLPLSSYTKQHDLPRVECLTSYTRLSQKRHILGRYHTLLEEDKLKNARIQRLASELTQLWVKFSFPILSQQAINARLTKLIEKNQCRPKKDFLHEMNNIFDITKVDGARLCREDKEPYRRQVETSGKVGYNTYKPAPISSAHPSKWQRHTPVSNHEIASTSNIKSETDTSNENSNSDTEGSSDDKPDPIRERNHVRHTKPQNWWLVSLYPPTKHLKFVKVLQKKVCHFLHPHNLAFGVESSGLQKTRRIWSDHFWRKRRTCVFTSMAKDCWNMSRLPVGLPQKCY